MPDRNACWTHKIRYPSRSIADREMRRINRLIPDRKPKLKRAYECPVCFGYHLTKQKGTR